MSNSYVIIVPEDAIKTLSALFPALQFLPIAAVQHENDPEKKKYLVNLEIETKHEADRTD